MHDCISKQRKKIMDEAPSINYVRFDLSDVIDISKNDGESMTGQRIWVGFMKENKKGVMQQREQKTFITHTYCPFCGKKYK